MFSQVILASLFVAAAIAAPAPSMNDGATPIIQLESNVPCTNVHSASIAPASSPSVILLGSPAPSPSVILLNSPAPPPPPTANNASNPYAGYAAAPQPSGTPPVVNLNAPPASPSLIKLNRRQFGSTSAASIFSFGGIVPSSAVPLSSPGTPTTSPPSNFSFGAIPTSPPSPASTAVPNGISVFTSTGPDGRETVFMLATVTVTGSACSSAPVFNPGFTPISSLAPSSNPPFFSLASTAPSLSPTSPAPSFFGANVQSPVTPSTTPLPNASVINLNTPTSHTGFSFSSAPSPT